MQYRLLGIVMAIGLLTLVIAAAAQPERWVGVLQWMSRAPKDATALDTRLNSQRTSLPEPIVVAARDPEDILEDQGPVATGGKLFPGVQREGLAAIEDNSRIRTAENPILFELLSLARAAKPEELERYSFGVVSFAQLFTQPNSYRGLLVTVVGRVHGVFKNEAIPNDADIKSYYELWIEPDDRRDPIVVYCTSLPEGFPVEPGGLKERVRVTGFFFKILPYISKGTDTRLAPMLLAASPDWTRPPPEPAPVDAKTGLTTAVVVGLIAAAIVVLLVLRFRPQRINPYTAGSLGDRFQRLSELEVAPDVAESLRRMEQDPPPPR